MAAQSTHDLAHQKRMANAPAGYTFAEDPEAHNLDGVDWADTGRAKPAGSVGDKPGSGAVGPDGGWLGDRGPNAPGTPFNPSGNPPQ
jgi:hypothetical protein